MHKYADGDRCQVKSVIELTTGGWVFDAANREFVSPPHITPEFRLKPEHIGLIGEVIETTKRYPMFHHLLIHDLILMFQRGTDYTFSDYNHMNAVLDSIGSPITHPFMVTPTNVCPNTQCPNKGDCDDDCDGGCETEPCGDIPIKKCRCDMFTLMNYGCKCGGS